jgi:hypothetical protein
MTIDLAQPQNDRSKAYLDGERWLGPGYTVRNRGPEADLPFLSNF